MKNIIYDLTLSLDENTVVFPGDPIFKRTCIQSIDNESNFNLSKIEMGNHTGTHIDFPVHVIPGGKNSSDYDMNELIDNGIIVHVPEDMSTITRSFVNNNVNKKYRIVFFQTKASGNCQKRSLNENYVHIELGAAEALLERSVCIVGIDSMSVDAYQDANLPTHQFLLSNNILIVENLNLENIVPGDYKIFLAPLKVTGMDGLPTRVFAQRQFG
jgi:arylformamidase